MKIIMFQKNQVISPRECDQNDPKMVILCAKDDQNQNLCDITIFGSFCSFQIKIE